MARDRREGFKLPVLDRLFDDTPGGHFEGAVQEHYTLAEIKQSVARDLESLLNTRQVLSLFPMDHYPHTARSVLGYGLEDFIGRSLLNPDDRHRICKSLEDAILAHEPRLKKVQVALEATNELIRELRFRVSAVLHIEPAREEVTFDAMLQPGTQHYVVKG